MCMKESGYQNIYLKKIGKHVYEKCKMCIKIMFLVYTKNVQCVYLKCRHVLKEGKKEKKEIKNQRNRLKMGERNKENQKD